MKLDALCGFKERGGLCLKLVVKYHIELPDTWPFGQTFMVNRGI